MRKLLLISILTLCLLLPAMALAEDQQVALPAIPAVLLLPEGVYNPVLIPDNLKDNGPFILSRGGTVEGWEEEFKTKGILLKAYDDKNRRLLVVTGLQDEDGQRFGDIDLQTADTRAEYRRLYLDDGPFSVQGYRVDSAEWKNFKQVGRFLMIKYSYRQGGEVLHRGFARRTVKNGLSIMVDMQVFGRALKAGDNTALNKVFDTLAFTGNVGEGVAMPVFLNESSTAPKETNKSSFTMSGMTRSGAKLTATLLLFSNTKPANFTAQADAKGNYSLPITLPGDGVYMLTLLVESEGLEPLEKTYPVNYSRNLLPVEFTSQLPETLTQDKYTISGVTDPATSVQMVVNGKSASKKSNGRGEFSFSVNTKEEGEYIVRLSFQKGSLDIRTFDITAVRGAASPGDQAGAVTGTGGAVAAQDQGEALSPSYTDLIAKADTYDGRLLTYDGFVTQIEQQAGDYVISLALRKGPAGYADTVILVADSDPGYAVDSKIRVYGILEGLGAEGADSAEHSYPKLRVQNITLLEEAVPEAGAEATGA